VSETPHPTDVEVSRVLNALVTSLNDWKLEDADREQLQAIVTGALGGEERIVVRAEPTGAPTLLADPGGKVLARLSRAEGRWIGERVGSPLSGGYIPSTPGRG
jgi:hypothetical protein